MPPLKTWQCILLVLGIALLFLLLWAWRRAQHSNDWYHPAAHTDTRALGAKIGAAYQFPVRSGDLLVTSLREKDPQLLRWSKKLVMNSVWLHVGIVVRLPSNQVYVL